MKKHSAKDQHASKAHYQVARSKSSVEADLGVDGIDSALVAVATICGGVLLASVILISLLSALKRRAQS